MGAINQAKWHLFSVRSVHRFELYFFSVSCMKCSIRDLSVHRVLLCLSDALKHRARVQVCNLGRTLNSY